MAVSGIPDRGQFHRRTSQAATAGPAYKRKVSGPTGFHGPHASMGRGHRATPGTPVMAW
jgi:hypothetical protein